MPLNLRFFNWYEVSNINFVNSLEFATILRCSARQDDFVFYKILLDRDIIMNINLGLSNADSRVE